MSFDVSRLSFHPWKDYLGVMMQQGRVQLDADWNEWVAELNRRIQVGTLDSIGRAVVPRTTPKGFEILAEGENLKIGVGRMYVDGLLAENHGAEPVAWEAGLAEQLGTKSVPFYHQPYLPFNDEESQSSTDIFNKPAMKGGPYLVYLDVWQREITCLQDPDLVEIAVGVDTTGRLQTVWQVKTVPVDADFTCSSADVDSPKWEELIRPSGARLSCTTGKPSGELNPCQMQPDAKYTGLENQLYRVEIHNDGSQGSTIQKAAATFKWSRDNGTVAARVLEIHNGSRLVVDSLGRDDVLGFHAGDWIEILDDWHELHNRPGRLHRIHPDRGIEKATRSIILQSALPIDLFPVDKNNKTFAERYTRIRRWDLTGVIRKADGTIYHELNASGVTPGIPVPAAGTQIFLENGILIDFSKEGKGHFRVGDHWVFAARATDGSIEELIEAPPRGIHHHYARLAMVSFPGIPANCRQFWPPEVSGESCDCTICVNPQGHNSGAATIQQAIDVIRERGGGTICLDVGDYLLHAPLDVRNARSLRLRGQGWRTILRATEAGKVINIARGLGVTIENLSVLGITGLKGTSAMISIKDCASLHCIGLTLAATATGGGKAVAVDLSGLILGACFEDSIVVADQGIGAILDKMEYLFTTELRITNNVFLCGQEGVSLRGACLHYGQTRLADNLLINCSKSGFALTGASLPQTRVTITENILHVFGVGIIGGIDGLRVEGNEIFAMAGKTKKDGILLQRDKGLLSSLALEAIHLSDNIIQFQGGHGIAVEHRLDSATVCGNTIKNVAGSGLVMSPASRAEYLRIENNRFASIGTGFTSKEEGFFGMLLMAVKRSDITGNLFSEVALQADTSPFLASAAAMAAREVRVTGNRFFNGGPAEFMGRFAAMVLTPGFSDASLHDNSITREVQVLGNKPPEWQAFLVYGDANAAEQAPVVFDSMPALACLRLEKGEYIYLCEAQILVMEEFAKIAVRGNVIRNEFSSIPSVQILVVESCLFNANDIEVKAGTNSTQIAGEIRSRYASLTNNRIVAGKEISFSLQVADKDKFSVMGNLRTGRIEVNGTSDTSLPSPWNALNVSI